MKYHISQLDEWPAQSCAKHLMLLKTHGILAFLLNLTYLTGSAAHERVTAWMTSRQGASALYFGIDGWIKGLVWALVPCENNEKIIVFRAR